MPKWPSPKDMEAVTRDHDGGGDWSFGPGMAETAADKIKYDVCAEFTLDRLLRYLEKLGIKYEFRRVA